MRSLAVLVAIGFLVAPGAPAQTDEETAAAAAAVALEATLGPGEGTAPGGEGEGAPGVGGIDGSVEGVAGLNLTELIERAAEHPIVGAARAQLDAYEAKLGQAHWAQWSGLSLNVLFTVIPRQSLTTRPGPTGREEYVLEVESADPQWSRSSWEGARPFVRLGVSGAIPLWTVGKLSSMQEAAEYGVDVGRGGVERARERVAWEVRRAYLSYLLARDILYLIDEGRGYIDDAREEVRARIDRGEGGGATIDLYKIDALAAEVDVRELQARRLEETALAGLRLLAALDETAVIADPPIMPFEVELRPISDYVDLAVRERPDLRMIEAAVGAQRAKAAYEQARYFPDLALGVTFGYAYSNAAPDHYNPWLADPYNYATYGAALLLDCPLDFGMDYWRVEEAEATLRRLERERDALAQLVELEVAEAHAAVDEARGRMEAWDVGRLAAKRWLIAVLQGMTLGLHEAGDLTDALVAYFAAEANYLVAIYDLDMAYANLALATGGDFLDGLEPRE